VTGVLAGFATIGIIIGLGFLLAQLRVLDATAQGVLTRVAFYVASPALMITVLGGTDVHRLLSANLIASLGSVAVAGTLGVLAARLIWRREAGETVIATFCSAYVNAGNLGLPIAAYALGDAAFVAPMLLTQLLILQPSGLAVLDAITYEPSPDIARRRLLLIRLSQPFRNPLAMGSLIGLALALSGFKLPVIINAPLTLIGGIAVPSVLLAYGISLRLGPRPGAGEPPTQIATLASLKLMVQPVMAYAIAAYALGLTGRDLLAVTVIAALPTAQNVFTFAVRYDRGVILARDTIFVTTVLSVPVILIIVGLLA
jgi:malonate transporter and related proteins